MILVTQNSVVASEKLLPEGGAMTRASIQEYIKAVRWRYLLGIKKDQG